MDWLSLLPFLAIHAGCLLVVWTGASPTAFVVLVATYVLRGFGLTAGYHRYFAHRSFKTGRAFQFMLAVLGASAAQMGPLWWAAHHRRHHRNPDASGDPHSPRLGGIVHAHVGWIFERANARTPVELVPDLIPFAELGWIDRHHWVAPAALIAALYVLGEALASVAPDLRTNGVQLVVFGFFMSTTLVYHLTFAVNSIGHSLGSRRFATGDDSRNNLLLALLTFGEGWHNNHHRYPAAERHGMARSEVDLAHAVLAVLARAGLVWGLRERT